MGDDRKRSNIINGKSKESLTISLVIVEISNHDFSFKTTFILFEDLIQCIKAT